MKHCRWGFLSTAEIGKKNWQAIKLAGNAKLIAVASRLAESADDFIAACQASAPMDDMPVGLGSYDALIDRTDIDAIYFPIPTGIRKDWVIKAANAGKHVLCEKPCGVNAAELRQMIDACHFNGVQFMDGVMMMHTERLEKLRSTLDVEVGTLTRIQSHLSFRGGPDFEANNIRTCSQLEPHGCLGDLGWYNIRFALWAMNWQLPTHVTGRILSERQRKGSDAAVPMSFSGELFFASGASSSFYCSFESHHQQSAFLSGTEGFVRMSDFVLPEVDRSLRFELNQAEFSVNECDFRMIPNASELTTDEQPNSSKTAQETRLFRTFSDIVNSGKTQPFWPEIALKTQQVVDACWQSARNQNAAVEL